MYNALSQTVKDGGEIEWLRRREEVIDLHSTSSSFEERSFLLGIYVALMNSVERAGAVNDIEEFRDLREKEYNMMLITEATDGKNIVPALLLAVTRREIAAGRMKADHELHELAEAGDRFLTPAPAKKGWLFKLFG
ncbi:MAG: hypothetical protein O9972_22830 [Burkholderiales bacterium]|nr:hypothetical protein [Burkholderiales bacterium]